MESSPFRGLAHRLIVAAPLALAGCWAAPVATVQPTGEPRLIQAAIAVESVEGPMIVQALDAGTRTVVLRTPAELATVAYRVGSSVSDFDQLRIGDRVQATVAKELSVYVLRNGQLPGSGGAIAPIATDAKILSVDPSYRLLTLEYPDGSTETFKVGLETKLREMAAGDDVVIRVVEVVALAAHER